MSIKFKDMKKILLLGTILFGLISCSSAIEVDCNCSEETTGYYENLNGNRTYYVSYKEIEYASCEDDGKLIEMNSTSSTVIRCN